MFFTIILSLMLHLYGLLGTYTVTNAKQTKQSSRDYDLVFRVSMAFVIVKCKRQVNKLNKTSYLLLLHFVL